MLSNKITVIIPEHRRPDHLRRLLDYFLSYGLKVIVADSSDVVFKYLNEFEDKIVYKFFPGMDLATKLSKIISYIQTPYVVMCANDDFLVPKALEELIDFLELNLDYNSAQGLYTDFKFENGNLISSLRYQDTTDINLSSDLATERLLALQRRYFQYYYAIFRISAFSKVISSLMVNDKSEIRNLCLLESYISCFGAIDGKHLIKPIFYSARENMETSAATETDIIPIVIKKAKYKEEYRSYLKLLSIHLSKVDGLKHSEASINIENSVKAYILNIYPDYYSLKGQIKLSLKSWLKKFGIAGFIKRFIVDKKNNNILPPHIIDSIEMKNIAFYIKKYDYIYKN